MTGGPLWASFSAVAGFNGATANSPWVNPCVGINCWTHWSFNGATANSPWMTCSSGGRRSWRRGCFNGATANSPWMTEDADARQAKLAELQWGHGEFAVDDHPW